MITPYCPVCGGFADRGLIVTRRRMRSGFALYREIVEQTARWHVPCWRLVFARRA